MKKIILSLIALIAAVSTNAQVLEVYKNGTHIETYRNTPTTKYRFVFKENTSINNHDFVEIGGIKWATMNVGATTVADSWETSYGDYYAWGELDTYYESLTETTVTMGKYTEKTHIKGTKIKYNFANYSGTNNWNDPTYNKFKEWDSKPYDANVLTAANDVASVMWGGSWRMPTFDDFMSLIEACGGADTPSTLSSGAITDGGIYWIPQGTTLDDVQYKVAGVLFVAKADPAKRVFFPAAGYLKNDERGGFGNGEGNEGKHSYYWTSSLSASETRAAYNLNIYEGGTVSSGNHFLDRCFGMPIRPVSDAR